jgi:hypothetical protein
MKQPCQTRFEKNICSPRSPPVLRRTRYAKALITVPTSNACDIKIGRSGNQVTTVGQTTSFTRRPCVWFGNGHERDVVREKVHRILVLDVKVFHY